MNSPSAAIMCIARNEQPFAEEWLEYHFKLGFDRIYLISTDDDFPGAKQFYSELPFGQKLSLHHFSDFKSHWQLACYASHLELVREDWLLILDLDEFLCLGAAPGLKEFLGEFRDGVGQIQFPWLNTFSDRYFHPTTFDILSTSRKHASNHVKSIVRRKHLRSPGIHANLVGGKATLLSSGEEVERNSRHETFVRNPSYYAHHPFVLHFCARGHFDVINRLTGHRFNNKLNGPNERIRLGKFLTGRAVWPNLPNRYLLAKVLQSLPVVDIDICNPELKSRTNQARLMEIFIRNISTTVDFACPDVSIIAQAFEQKFALNHKLTLLDLDDSFDLEEYLQSVNQSGFLARLRRKLNG